MARKRPSSCTPADAGIAAAQADARMLERLTLADAERQKTCEALVLALGFGATAIRNSDALDFHECSVASVMAALRSAFGAGFAAGAR